MTNNSEFELSCSQFEEYLTDYLDGTLERSVHRAVAAHALRCPICHTLLNEIKSALDACHDISAPKASMSALEGRILAMTMPETAMSCEDFENYLTDYLDGFLPAVLFHRWERHAVLCSGCTDLPGEVVRSIAACYTYKSEELPVPAGLHQRIMQATIEADTRRQESAKIGVRLGEWLRAFGQSIRIPQFAPVAMMFIFAIFVMSQTVNADGSIGGLYQKSFALAEQTYNQGASILSNQPLVTPSENQQPVQGTFVNEEK